MTDLEAKVKEAYRLIREVRESYGGSSPLKSPWGSDGLVDACNKALAAIKRVSGELMALQVKEGE